MVRSIVLPEVVARADEAALALGAPLAEAARASVGTWLELLLRWNARVDLTAARSASELSDLMLADALVLSLRVPAGARLVDVGTGAGAPGLALALLRPDLEVTLVEPLAKRASFLRTVVGTLGLTKVTLVAEKGEAVAAREPRFDVATARATLAPPAWLGLAGELVRGGGSAWVFLAKEAEPTHPRFLRKEEVAYVWPLTRASRRLVRYERSGG